MGYSAVDDTSVMFALLLRYHFDQPSDTPRDSTENLPGCSLIVLHASHLLSTLLTCCSLFALLRWPLLSSPVPLESRVRSFTNLSKNVFYEILPRRFYFILRCP